MNGKIWSKRTLGNAGILVFTALSFFFLWQGFSGLGFWGFCAGIGLLLSIGALLYLRQMEVNSENKITQRITAEYSAEAQPQVFGMYEHLKTKNLEGLFQKILDDANGDLSEAKKLTGIAESVGWNAFIENRW